MRMLTVGEILKKARLEKRVDFEDVEKATKIRRKFLQALEENAWEKLPSLPYIKGFIRTYSSYLNLKPEEMVAIFRRHFSEQEKTGLLPQGLTHPLNQPIFNFTPASRVTGIVIAFLLLFFGYLFFQYQAYTSPPALLVNQPQEGELVKSAEVNISGKTDEDAVISINNQKIALSNGGEFTTTVLLSPGVNSIIIESTSKYGKKKTVTRTIQVAEESPE